MAELKSTTIDGDLDVTGSINIDGINIIDLVYPVGSIYMSVQQNSATVNDTNKNGCPIADIYGGTWKRIEDAILIGAGNTYNVNTTGGSFSHIITNNELPSHSHSFTPTLSWSAKLEEKTVETGNASNSSATVSNMLTLKTADSNHTHEWYESYYGHLSYNDWTTKKNHNGTEKTYAFVSTTTSTSPTTTTEDGQHSHTISSSDIPYTLTSLTTHQHSYTANDMSYSFSNLAFSRN